jgi:hypothetical protein
MSRLKLGVNVPREGGMRSLVDAPVRVPFSEEHVPAAVSIRDSAPAGRKRSAPNAAGHALTPWLDLGHKGVTGL